MQFGGVVAVNNLSMDVAPGGKITALIGPNGAGKTTAFNCITGVYEPTNGLVTFMGEPMVRNHPAGKMKKQYLGENGDKYAALKPISPTPDSITKLGIARTFQNIRLWKSMTVFDNVLTAKHMRAKQNVFTATFRISSRGKAHAGRDHGAAGRAGTCCSTDDLATSLPYGLQRRLEIARALATEPKLLLLDEPAAGMNPQETQELAEFIVQTKDKYGLTVFLIEHHMDLVMKISDYIYVIDFGSEISEGVPSEVQNNQRVIDAYLGVVDDE
jgi:branched-chain amino acid transport system ATP-binding protein